MARPDLTDTEARALSAIDLERGIAELLDLLAIPSVTGTPAESEAQHWLARRLDAIGLETDLWSMDLADLRGDPGFPGTEAPREEAWGLVATTPATGGDGPVLILQGHVDVVPPGDLAKWATDPFEPRVVDGVIHGRGACDMKAGVIANLMAIRALNTAGIRLAGQVALHSVVSEEDGGLGAFGTLARGHRGDACVITEPTSGNAMTANAGALTFTLRVPGQATHGSTRYAGVSAIDAFLPVYRALADLEAERNASVHPMMTDYQIPYPIAVGVVRSGDWASTVPDLLIAEGRYGVAIGERVEEARAMFERRIADVCAADPWLSGHPVVVEWTGGQFASGQMPEGDPLLPLTQAAWADVTGGDSRQVGAPYGSDLRLYAGEGIPTLQFGPGAAYHAHSPIEQVRVDELERVAQSLVLLVLRATGSGC